jgi:hypothetical protein
MRQKNEKKLISEVRHKKVKKNSYRSEVRHKKCKKTHTSSEAQKVEKNSYLK